MFINTAYKHIVHKDPTLAVHPVVVTLVINMLIKSALIVEVARVRVGENVLDMLVL